MSCLGIFINLCTLVKNVLKLFKKIFQTQQDIISSVMNVIQVHVSGTPSLDHMASSFASLDVF